MNLLLDSVDSSGHSAVRRNVPLVLLAFFARVFVPMAAYLADLDRLKEKLLLMASHAEAAVNQAVRAMLRRDDDLARRTREEDSVIDRLELEIDHAVLEAFSRRPGPFELRLLTSIMKIARELERVGDEATTISRRCLELSNEPPLRQRIDVQEMARASLELLKDSLDAFVNGDPVKARAVVPRDKTVNRMHRDLQAELARHMAQQPGAITRCLHLMTVLKSLERIGDHATNVAEVVVYLYEGQEIRHAALKTE
jgi:phosphate transport system protein